MSENATKVDLGHEGNDFHIPSATIGDWPSQDELCGVSSCSHPPLGLIIVQRIALDTKVVVIAAPRNTIEGGFMCSQLTKVTA